MPPPPLAVGKVKVQVWRGQAQEGLFTARGRLLSVEPGPCLCPPQMVSPPSPLSFQRRYVAFQGDGPCRALASHALTPSHLTWLFPCIVCHLQDRSPQAMASLPSACFPTSSALLTRTTQHETSDTSRIHFPHTPNHSPADTSSVQLSFDTLYLETASDPTG